MSNDSTSPVSTPGSTRTTITRPGRGYEAQPEVVRLSKSQRAVRAARDTAMGVLATASVVAPFAAWGALVANR